MHAALSTVGVDLPGSMKTEGNIPQAETSYRGEKKRENEEASKRNMKPFS